MTKKILVAALAVAATLLVASNSFAATSTYCTGGANLQFVGVGSSAQINALAFAAVALLQKNNAAGDGHSYALISFGGSSILDEKAGKSDTGITTFVAYDPTATGPCKAYIYFQTDSGVGDKDFFRYEKYTATNSTSTAKQHFLSVAAAYANLPAEPVGVGNKIPGLPDKVCVWNGSACTGTTDPNGVPDSIWQALDTTPETYVNHTIPPVAPAYCGNVSTVAVTSQFYCYFNAAGTDIRPEDALYATNRGLAAYNGIIPPAFKTTTELTGLGYGTASTKGCTPGTPITKIGCGFWDSFAQGSTFNVLAFALSGSDPIASGTLPHYTTLSVGASPVVVIVGDEDTSAGGLGHKTSGNYDVSDINRQVLAQVFSGQTACIGDLLSTTASATGAGKPLQVIQRESLSGTYNTFEFTGIRTQAGGPWVANAIPPANSGSGQEQFNDPVTFPGYTGNTDCSYSSGEVVGTHPGYPNANCFNPLYLSYDGVDIFRGSQCQGTAGAAPGLPVRLRAIGTGQLVKGVVGTLNNTTASPIPNTNVYNPIGYSFWGYSNLNPLCSGVSGTSCTGHWLGHYLTVDGIDPLFTTEGGQYDPTPNPSPFNPPVCAANSTGAVSCNPIPFTHVQDGKYPLWSLLRTVTIAPYSLSGKPQTFTPPGVLDMIANEETSSATDTLDDYVPFETNITGSCDQSVYPPSCNYTGNLGLFVFRSHFKQTGGAVNPANGHYYLVGTTKTICPTTDLSIVGGNSLSPTCWVDFGNDVGGSVIPVQKDFDFILDFNTEEYGLKQ